MKKLLSIAALAVVLGFGSVAQADVLRDWTYKAHFEIESFGANGSFYDGNMASIESDFSEGSSFDFKYFPSVDSIEGAYSNDSFHLAVNTGSGEYTFAFEFGLTPARPATGGPFDSYNLAVLPGAEGHNDRYHEFELDGMKYQVGARYMVSIIDTSTSTESVLMLPESGIYNIHESTPFLITYNFFVEHGPVDDPQATPEPATMLLMGAGFAGLGYVKRRRSKV